jgi:CheY-specific phosphatase CheX
LEEPTNQDVLDQLLEPFIAGVHAALSEMAGTEVAVQSVHRATELTKRDDIEVMVELTSANLRVLILSFPEKTATNLARNILAENAPELDESLIQDSMGEIANVVAGQAKSLLAGTPDHLTFSLPKLFGSSDELRTPEGMETFAATFLCDHGPFVLQVMRRTSSGG